MHPAFSVTPLGDDPVLPHFGLGATGSTLPNDQLPPWTFELMESVSGGCFDRHTVSLRAANRSV
jgi:hypothetical protein